jgi:PhzF family phenazine biosynthesis protein
MTMRVHQLKCFGAAPGDGNLALVVEQGSASEADRQAMAREHNATCVFLDRPGDGPPVLDYYYPHTRSPLCLHATLAVARLLVVPVKTGTPFPPHSGAVTVQTALHAQPLLLSRDADAFYVQLAAQPVAPPPLPDLPRLLGDPGLRAEVASIGSPKLLVEVPDADTLYALQPDLPAITAWGRTNGVNGIYAWCRHPDGRYEGRNFNHLDPALEDSATGVAAGALTLLLGHGLTLLQGRATGRHCLIRTRIDGDTVSVGGAAAAV